MHSEDSCASPSLRESGLRRSQYKQAIIMADDDIKIDAERVNLG